MTWNELNAEVLRQLKNRRLSGEIEIESVELGTYPDLDDVGVFIYCDNKKIAVTRPNWGLKRFCEEDEGEQ